MPFTAPKDDLIKEGGFTAPSSDLIDNSPSLAEKAVTAISPENPNNQGGGFLSRLAQGTKEMFAPSMEGVKRLFNPNAGQFGPSRVLEQAGQQVGSAVRGASQNIADSIASSKFGQQNPDLSAGVGAGIGTLADVTSNSLTPSGVQQQIGAEGAIGAGKAGEMALRELGGNAGKLAISTISPATYPDVVARFEDPAAVKGAMTREQLGNSAVSSAKALSDQIGMLDAQAKSVLSTEPTISKSTILDRLNALKEKYTGSSGKAVSAEAKGALAEISNAIDGVNGVNPLPDVAPIKTNEFVSGGDSGDYYKTIPGQTGRTAENISEAQLKDIQSQYKNINWDDPAGGAKKEVRKIFDSVLKSENPDYAAAMKPVAERTRLQDIITKKLGLKYDPTTGTYATDATAGKWTPALLDGKKPETSAALRKLDQFTGNDLLGKAKLTGIRERFEGGRAQGSRMTQIGRSVGAATGAGVGAVLGGHEGAVVGGVSGGALGGVAGASMDKVGGPVSAGLIDFLAKTPTIPSLPTGLPPTLLRLIQSARQSAGLPPIPSPAQNQAPAPPINLPNFLSPGTTTAQAETPNWTPDQKAYRAGLGQLLRNNDQGAISAWQKALRLNKNNLEARRGLERLAMKRGLGIDSYKPK